MTELQKLKENVSGIGDSTLEKFEERGYKNLENLRNIPRDELLKIPGVGGSTANDIIEFLDKEGLRGRVSKKIENRRKLKRLLKELFQFDASDLDFGIYRIMNQKRRQIEKFIEEDLIEAVEEKLEEHKSRKVKELTSELEELKGEVKKQLGEKVLDSSGKIIEKEVPDAPFAQKLAERYKSKRQKLKEIEISEEVEATIFNDLYNFFKRYYDKGDFVTKRRYSKEDKYAIPYNGEEVHFHWSNKGQYYVKSGEYFNNYKFHVDDLTVLFQLKNTQIEISTRRGEEGYFVLYGKNPIKFKPEDKKVLIDFQYRPLDDKIKKEYNISPNSRTKQKDIRKRIIRKVLEEVPASVKEKLNTCKRGDNKTALEKHLRRYTTKNKADFFIHKNLKQFLNRELNYYIKNEIVRVDDIGSREEKSVKEYLSRVKVVKELGQKIIDFLAQIEELQKRLFEKKKFVVSTEYCITLDKIPEKFYDEILENEEQVNEWKNLYNLEEAVGGSPQSSSEDLIDKNFLKQNQSLMVDTKFFSQDFKDRLLATFDNLDKDIEGRMIHSENFQALNLILDKYRERVKCIYLDPPYNTGQEFIYKDNYRDSSWLSMMRDRLLLAKSLLEKDGAIFISVDYHEMPNLRKLCDEVFGEDNFRNTIVVRRGVKRVQAQFEKVDSLTRGYEYILFYSKSSDTRFPNLFKELEEKKPGGWNNHWRGTDRPTMRYELFGIKPETGQWRWSEERSKRAIRNYKKMKKELRKQGKDLTQENIDEWYTKKLEETGKERIDLLRYNEKNDTVEHYVPPKKEEMLTDVWFDISPYGSKTLQSLFGDIVYDNPKPVPLIQRLARFITDEDDTVLDFFAGSGTTGHSVIDLNERDGSARNYIMVEMGNYFNTVMKPRIQKVVFSDEWTDGIPRLGKGKSHIFTYQRLEQYEDSLNNIKFSEDGTQKAMTAFDDYFLKYMLNFETRKSSTFLDIDKLKNPFQYKLKIMENGEQKTEVVDLVETFNYLLGIDVRKREFYENEGRKYRVVRGEKDDNEILVVWRSTKDLDLESDSEFIKEKVLSGNEDRVHINGDTFISEATPIEKTFKQKIE